MSYIYKIVLSRDTMEAIKKKMQAMKVEKDNLMDRCDACEQVKLFNVYDNT